MKRFLAVLLSLILAAGSLFVAAFAADGKKRKSLSGHSLAGLQRSKAL